MNAFEEAVVAAYGRGYDDGTQDLLDILAKQGLIDSHLARRVASEYRRRVDERESR